MDRIAEDVWQRILRQEAEFLAAINGRLRRVSPVKTYGEWIPKDAALTT
jgi:hypothetical protein